MPNSYLLKWDQTGERWYQNGVSHGVLFPMTSEGTYGDGVVWNGLTGIDENPDGGDITDLWADNIKYASFRNPENYGGTIKAYTYPDEWLPCDGQKAVGGVVYQGQKRQPFGLCYRTELGNDTMTDTDDAYILHLVYNATVSPSSKSHATQNENPDAEEMSWDFKSLPVAVEGVTGVAFTSKLELDSRKLTATKMAAIEQVLYGTPAVTGTNAAAAVPARLPLPGEVASIIAAAT